MKGRDLTMKKMDRVDRTVLGTVGSCILKSIAFDFWYPGSGVVLDCIDS